MIKSVLPRWLSQRTKTVARLLFWPLLALALTASALELGIWTIEEAFDGPFASEAGPGRRSYIVSLGREQSLGCCLDARGDTLGHSEQSNLRLWIDGREMGPPHTIHETIRAGGTAGFSHWYSNLIFPLPAGVENAAGTRALVRYSLYPPRGATLVLILISGLLAWRAYSGVLATAAARWGQPAVRALLWLPFFFLRLLLYFGLAGSLVYVACAIYAFFSGWALPTTALIRWSAAAEQIARIEPRLGHILLTLAAVGTVTLWLAPYLHAGTQRLTDEVALRRFLGRWGFLITTCAFVFSMSSLWLGILRPGDLDNLSIGGLVPFSDAAGYLAGAHDQARDGVWNTISLRRPLAAAFRSVLLFGGNFSNPSMLLSQAVLLSAAMCAATAAVMRWRGLWAGVAFYGLAYIYVRPFIPTTMTEPIGLFWALVSIPFFVEALRAGSLTQAMIAFASMTLALMTRMGSMFTIPALMLWMTLEFGDTLRARLRILALSIAIFGGIVLSHSLLQRSYGTNVGMAGSNFSYILCGLTAGKNWTACPEQIREEGIVSKEVAISIRMYSLAWKNFSDDPSVLFGRLASGAVEFCRMLPDILLLGYTNVGRPAYLLSFLWWGIVIAGLLLSALQRPTRREISFWLLVWASVLSSSSFVIFDDGARVLAVSFPLLWLFLAGAFTTTLVASESASYSALSLQARVGALIIAVAALLFLFIPWLAHRLSPASTAIETLLPQ